MRRLRRTATVIAALLAALVVAAYVALSQLEATAYREDIERRVAEATGRQFTIAGPMDFAFGLRPAIAMERVRLANAGWAAGGDMATVERFELELALWPLLVGDIRIRRLVLIEPKLNLARHEDGRANWQMPGPGADDDAKPQDGGRIPRVEQVRIDGGTVAYADAGTGRRLTLALDRARIRPARTGDALRIDAAGTYQHVPFELSGDIGSPAVLASGRGDYAVDVTLAAAAARLDIAGRIPLGPTEREAAIEIAAEVEDLSRLTPAAGTELPSLGPLAARAQLTWRDGDYRLRGLDAKLGGSDLSGEMTVAPGQGRPRVTADLKSAVIDLADFGTQRGGDNDGRGDSDANRRSYIFPETALPLEWLRAIEGEADIKVGSLQLRKGLQLSQVKAHIALADGQLSLKPLSARLARGMLTGEAGLTAGKGATSINLDLAAGDVDYGRLLADLDVAEGVQGTAGGRVRLQGTGSSPRAIASSLSGRVALTSEGGRITNDLLRTAGADAARVLAPWQSGDAGMRINCIVARFAVADGVMTTEALLTDTETATVAGDGRISLAEEIYDLRFVPQAKQPSLASLAIPIEVAGPLNDPKMTPEPLGAAKAGAVALGTLVNPLTAAAAVLIDSMDTEDNACAAALTAARSERQNDGGGDGARGGVADDVKGFLDELGRSIDEELGVESDGREDDPAVLQDGDGGKGR